jgi:hypothetical protein
MNNIASLTPDNNKFSAKNGAELKSNSMNKKKKIKAQAGTQLIPLPLDNLKPIQEPKFKDANEYYSWHRNQALGRMKPEDVELYKKELEHSQANADAIIALRDPSGGFKSWNEYSKPKKVPYGNVLGRAYGLKHGGKIKDNKGQWNHPGEITEIDSNFITMKGVNYPVLGVSDSGDSKIMLPDKNYKFKGNRVTEYPLAQNGTQMLGMFNQQPIQLDWGSEGLLDLNNDQNNNLNQIGQVAGDLIQGVQMLGQARDQKKQAKQFSKLSSVVKDAAGLAPDKVKRKYVRPEDNIIDPNTLASSYGSGTNYLAKNGKKLQNGQILPQFTNFIDQASGFGNSGNVGNMLGSLIGGGKGQPGGAGKIGSTLGSLAGSAIPGVGTVLGGFLGGAVGGLIDGGQRKQIEKYQKRGQKNLGIATFNQGTKGIHNQYTAFMEDGGKVPSYMQMGGELEVYDNNVEQLSQNPYLGETVMFTGPSHENGGTPIRFGNSQVEVEGGEPATKIDDGLTVFGNMKIPSYGVSELNDPKAKGKKFKTYITELSKTEDKQNKILNKGLELIENSDMSDPYEKLTFASGKAMVEGTNMKLKEIADKKRIASDIQNAILETAEELNIDSDKLAKGKIKKAKNGKKIAQNGWESAFKEGKLNRKDVDRFLFENEGWEKMDAVTLRKITNTPGTTSSQTGSPEFNKWFAKEYKKNPGGTANYKGKPIRLNLATNTPGSSKEDYLSVYDDPMNLKPVDTSPLTNIKPSGKLPKIPQMTRNNFENEMGENNNNLDMLGLLSSVMPYLRPSNQTPLDPNQLSGEMFALSTNQLEPVQAQQYQPLLEQVSDISLQDQLNANQADFNAIKRLTANNPAAQAVLAGQKYQANTGVLGEQFRLNQTQRINTYNKNREVLNDATLKNLQILDQQYVRQAGAKAKTKAVAQEALNSIADKIAKNKLENRTLGIYENLYNYRFGPRGHAWNLNAPMQFNTQGANLPVVDSQGKEVTEVDSTSVRRDRYGMPVGSTSRRTEIKKPKKKGNGGIVKAMKGY